MNILFVALLAAAMSSPLSNTTVTTDWLAQNLDNPAVVVVEIGSAPTVAHPHIPGAHFVSIDSIVRREGWPPDETQPIETMRTAFENAGVGDEGRIVLYSSDPLFATRAWFTLDYLGQGHRAAILDGGFGKWLHEGRPTTTKRPPYLPKTFTVRVDPKRLISHADMRAANFTPGFGLALIDARSPYEFHGYRRGQQVDRRGHIPNAQTIAWQSNVAKNGCLRDAQHLKALYENAVGTTDNKVVVYCRTGMEASMPYFVLRSLGYDVALYDGSYTEWSRDKTAPVIKTTQKR